ncbi:MAG: phosphodiester glycosidase family protein [Ruminococcaceae bacterium]|nr:phosphodiester glycosidase family protein [Oscillospiraceae bacterium]
MDKEKRKFGKMAVVKVAAVAVAAVITVGMLLLYGPYAAVRDLIITSAMTTMSHQWIAQILFSEQAIEKAMRDNTIIEIDEKTDTSLINIPTSAPTPTDTPTATPAATPTPAPTAEPENTPTPTFTPTPSPTPVEIYIQGPVEEQIYEIVDISTASYRGWLVKVFDPRNVTLDVSKRLFSYGEKVSKISARNGALAAVNASGFMDENGKGNGGTPTGLVIKNGETLAIDFENDPSHRHSVIGFDENSVLIVGKYYTHELEALKLRCAVEFSPFLVINGKPCITRGNGGWGVGPRTAIGQTADGTVLFVIIDGRSVTSIGATLREVQDIMIANGAINASNLDGGSSSVLTVNHKVINTPSGPGGERYVPNAFLIMPKEKREER